MIVQVDGVLLGTASGAAMIFEAAGCRVVVSDPTHQTLVVTGTAGELERAARAFGAVREPGLAGVGEAVRLAIARDLASPVPLTVGTHRFNWAERIYVMGILNATPDSFSDAGKYFQFDDAVRRAHEMAAEGADMIEVGGQTARPGEVIPVEEELARIVPLLERLRAEMACRSRWTPGAWASRVARWRRASSTSTISAAAQWRMAAWPASLLKQACCSASCTSGASQRRAMGPRV